MKTIKFNIKYESRVKQKLERFIELYNSQIKPVIYKIEIKRDLNNPSIYLADFVVDLDKIKKEEIIFSILQMSNKLHDSGYLNWRFLGPSDKEQLRFECILNNEDDDQPLKWAQIKIE